MKELIEIQSELKAPKSQYNSFGKYSYRNLEDIFEALKPLLKKNECFITVSDEVVLIGNRFYVKATATITNSAGDKVSNTAFARESLTKKGMDDSQITGGTSSYARKYAFNGLFAIDDTKDSDATNQGHTPPAQPAKQNASALFVSICKQHGVDPKVIADRMGVTSADPQTVEKAVANQKELLKVINEVKNGN